MKTSRELTIQICNRKDQTHHIGTMFKVQKLRISIIQKCFFLWFIGL